MIRALKNPKKRTRAEEPASFKSAEMAAIALFASIIFFFLLGMAVDRHVPSGVIVGVLALLISAGMLAYWWKAYRDRGLKSKPRISFREVYVLYFGMSVEVGLIVHAMLGHVDIGIYSAALFLPPVLIGIIAGMDDTPYARNAERRPLLRGAPRKSSAPAEIPGAPVVEHSAPRP